MRRSVAAVPAPGLVGSAVGPCSATGSAPVVNGTRELPLPGGQTTLAALRDTLTSRGGAWSDALAADRTIRAAVNQEMADAQTAVKDGDEIAFFPPVTGG